MNSEIRLVGGVVHQTGEQERVYKNQKEILLGHI